MTAARNLTSSHLAEVLPQHMEVFRVSITTKNIEVAGRALSIETGRVAEQANGAVVIRQGDSVVLSVASSFAQTTIQERYLRDVLRAWQWVKPETARVDIIVRKSGNHGEPND